MSDIPILQLVKAENINRYRVDLQNSVYKDVQGMLSVAYVLRINNENGSIVCKHIASKGYEKVLDSLNLMQSTGQYPYYILLPEFMDAGICWLDWWLPAMSRSELDALILENTMSDDFTGLISWLKQLKRHEK
jgi:hypothetical protein